MSNKSLAEKLAAAKANSPINDLTKQQQTLKITHATRNIDYQKRNNTGIANSKKAKCKTPWGEFDTIKEAALAGNISEDTLRRRIRTNVEGFERIGKNNNTKYTKPIHTPFGDFPSKVSAGAFAVKNGIMVNAEKKIDKYLKTDPENYYYL